MKNKKGFTLLEILLVVAAIGILASIVILAINPSKQLGDTRNAQRQADINAILNATYQYMLDEGEFPASVTNVPTEICAEEPCDGLIDLFLLTTNNKYLTGLPEDPAATGNGTGYTIVKTASNNITVAAPEAENGKTISLTR